MSEIKLKKPCTYSEPGGYVCGEQPRENRHLCYVPHEQKGNAPPNRNCNTPSMGCHKYTTSGR